ncbi:unnamed protein product [Toxocara canis]|uniref:KTSC domain-containing protein n=1 Tax=Toxocara canis TaxID=6265 RepID=A0A183TX24_TOXCA|nr:unnamed protein product [Toxocara canis]
MAHGAVYEFLEDRRATIDGAKGLWYQIVHGRGMKLSQWLKKPHDSWCFGIAYRNTLKRRNGIRKTLSNSEFAARSDVDSAIAKTPWKAGEGKRAGRSGSQNVAADRRFYSELGGGISSDSSL